MGIEVVHTSNNTDPLLHGTMNWLVAPLPKVSVFPAEILQHDNNIFNSSPEVFRGFPENPSETSMVSGLLV